MRRKSICSAVIFAISLLLVASYCSHAQHSSVSGSVIDQSGATIPKIAVRLDGPNGATYTTETDGTGKFTFPDALPGSYTLVVTAWGFRTFTERVEARQSEEKVANVVLHISPVFSPIFVEPVRPTLHLEETPAEAFLSAPSDGKPCPARIRVAADGDFYFDHAGVWFKQSPAMVETYIRNGCYPEGGPSPTSSVTIAKAPNAPASRMRLLYSILEKTGWPKDRVTVEPWSGTN